MERNRHQRDPEGSSSMLFTMSCNCPALPLDGGSKRDERIISRNSNNPRASRCSRRFGRAEETAAPNDHAAAQRVLVGRGGLEPPTSRLSGVRSNHLSYRPKHSATPNAGCRQAIATRMPRGTWLKQRPGPTRHETLSSFRLRRIDRRVAISAISSLNAR